MPFTQLQLRRGTYYQWLTAIVTNEVTSYATLADGEIGIEIDTNKFKIGNSSQYGATASNPNQNPYTPGGSDYPPIGTSYWINLPYAAIPDTTGSDIGSNAGLNAYIHNATATATFDSFTGQITYTILLYGNSTSYNIVFDYNSQLPPTSLSLIKNGSGSPWYPTSGQPTGPFVNYSVPKNNNYTTPQTAPNAPMKITFTTGSNGSLVLPSNITPNTYTIGINIDTAFAGGSGVGSSFSFTTNVVVVPVDTMGSPAIGIVGTRGTIYGAYISSNSSILNIYPTNPAGFNVGNIIRIANSTTLNGNANTILNGTYTIRTKGQDGSNNWYLGISNPGYYGSGSANGTVSIITPDGTTPSFALTTSTPTIISGIQYYGYGTILGIPSNSLEFTNIFNINHTVSGFPNFQYMTFSDGKICTTQGANGLFYYNSGAFYYYYDGNDQGANNRTYYTPLLYVTITNTPRMYASLTNALNKTTTNVQVYPTLYSGTSTDLPIGFFLDGTINELAIPTSNPAIVTFQRGKLSSDPGSLPSGSSTSFVTFPSGALISSTSIYDMIYLPFDSSFHADSVASTLASYQLPGSYSYTSANKYLALKISTNSSALSSFTLNLSSTNGTGTYQNIQSVAVLWYGTSGVIGSGWYDARSFGISPTNYDTIWRITDPTGTYATQSVGSYVYLLIRSTGYIKMTDISIQ